MELLESNNLLAGWSGFELESTPLQSKKITGAELEPKATKYSKTLLSWAVENGHDVMVKLLLEKGAEKSLAGKYYAIWLPLPVEADNEGEAIVYEWEKWRIPSQS